MQQNAKALIIAASILVTALILSNAYVNRNRTQDTISVTGLGSKDFVSDLIVWSGSFTQRASLLKDAYAQLDRDRETIRKYLVSKGIDAGALVFSSVDIEKEFSFTYDENGNERSRTFVGYKLVQRIQVESPNVDKVESVSREVSELINLGIEFYSNNPEYYYTKLAELKIEMIAEATKDANVRAQRMAENAGSGVGRLKDASMGVFQIVAQNSSEEYSWGGSFNTSSKRKTANITVKLEYETE